MRLFRRRPIHRHMSNHSMSTRIMAVALCVITLFLFAGASIVGWDTVIKHALAIG